VTPERIPEDAAPSAGPAEREGATFARFWEARGLPVLDAAGAFWVPWGGRLYGSVPWARRLDPERSDLAGALSRARVLGVRYPSARGVGWPSGLYVVEARSYSLALADKDRRREIRRGLAASEIRALDPDELLREGLELNRDTMRRQRRWDPEFGDEGRWPRFVRAVRDTPGLMAHGAFTGGRLASYRVCCTEGRWRYSLYAMNRTRDLPSHAGIALEYALLALAAEDPRIERVSSGFAALFPGSSLHAVKIGVGYAVQECRLGVQLHPAAERLLASAWAAGAARIAARLRPGHHRLAAGAALLEAARRTRAAERSR
jgi:hypothetical protein